MNLTKEILVCDTLNDIPDFKSIRSMPRGIEWEIIFSDKIKSRREKIGKQWKFDHPKFQIGIHISEPCIRLVKLITDEEIEENQNFFEMCAKDYRKLATKLITEFAEEYGVQIDPNYPMNTLYHTDKFGYKPFGKFREWRYAFHGFHCEFTNLKNGQYIEVPLMCGLEFGELDPYFFSKYIKTTKKYKPLPVKIYDDYSDGCRILDKMLELGKFEKIQSNWPDRESIVVSDRKKTDVKVYDPESESNEIELHTANNNKASDTRKMNLKNNLWSKLKTFWS